MLKKLFVAVLLACCCLAAAPAAFAQAKPRLGILPFTGGAGGDGETIATLFSFQPDILNAFTVVPRTSAVNALVAEQNFQMAGYTDSDTISRMGRLLNADFVVSGFIRRLGDRNLVITTIVNVESFEQLAGDYREYRTIEEVPDLLPDISRIIIDASRNDTSKMPKLAIVPFHIANVGVNVQDAEVLAQILSIEIGNAGKYIVLPRTTAIQAAMKELEYQMSGATAMEEAKALGQAINAQYVLNAEVRSLGTMNMFTSSILHVEDGSLLVGGYRNYRTITDGIKLMSELGGVLTGRTVPPDNKTAAKAIDTEADRAARLWTLGVSLGSAFTDPLIIATLHGTIAPLKYSFLELGCDIGFVSVYPYTLDYYSVYPFAHAGLFFPFRGKGGFYLGAGGGWMIGEYTFSEGKAGVNIPAADFFMGFNLGNIFDISWTLRTDFGSASGKFSAGFVKRF